MSGTPAPAAAPAHVMVDGLCVTVRTADGGRKAIVDDVSFAVAKGEVLALIGQSGSGKTTIALALLGHTRPGAQISGGTITVGQQRIDQLDDAGLCALRGHRISYIAQSAAAAFNPSRTIMDQVIEPMLVHGLAGKEQARAKAVDLFRALALPQPETIGLRYPHQVSGGQLQRLMAAMALITDPELVILDEPTTALDVTTQVEVLKAFKSVLAACGASAIYVSHDLAVVAQMADRIAVLNHGRLQEEGSAQQVLTAPQSDYTKTLLAAARPVQIDSAQDVDGDALLRVSGVTAGYGVIRKGIPAIPVLTDISLSLPRGSALGIIGESGSGKSTLAQVIAGLLPSAAGSVALGGVDLPRELAHRSRDQLRRVQIVFQNADTALNPAHDVATILGRPLTFFHGLRGPALHDRVGQLLDLIHLPRDVADRPVQSLSGGQKQRINLARALAAEPDLLLCDEVTSALDTVVGAAILSLIDDLRRKLGITTVFISHDISTVRAFCDQVLVLYGGTVVEQAGQAQFEKGPHHPYTSLLMQSVPELRQGWLEHGAAVAQPALPAASMAPGLCRFLARCPLAVAGLCDSTPPPLQSAQGHTWLCHHQLAAR